MKKVISLYDYTGVAVTPWAKAGYECFCYDIQHEGHTTERVGDGLIHKINADLHEYETLCALVTAFEGEGVVFGLGFPVCTDLAVSGAAHFKRKAEADPDFQIKAAKYARWCAEFFEDLGVPYMIENPVSVLATLWRKPDFSFHPFEYGDYIPDDEAQHPTWPEYIQPKDAYKKKTCLWTGGGFVMPEPKPVDPEAYHGDGYATQMMKLGGKSARTKNIRSATPRGFSEAVYQANRGWVQLDWVNLEASNHAACSYGT